MSPPSRPTDDTLSTVGRWLLAIAVVTLATLVLWMAGCSERTAAYGANPALCIGESIA